MVAFLGPETGRGLEVKEPWISTDSHRPFKASWALREENRFWSIYRIECYSHLKVSEIWAMLFISALILKTAEIQIRLWLWKSTSCLYVGYMPRHRPCRVVWKLRWFPARTQMQPFRPHSNTALSAARGVLAVSPIDYVRWYRNCHYLWHARDYVGLASDRFSCSRRSLAVIRP